MVARCSADGPAYASATGGEFLGFPVPKGVPLILQLEEGGTFKRRVKAVGLAKSAGSDGLKLREEWFYSKTFDLAKPRQVEQLKLLIRNNVDLVLVDSARAVARSLQRASHSPPPRQAPRAPSPASPAPARCSRRR